MLHQIQLDFNGLANSLSNVDSKLVRITNQRNTYRRTGSPFVQEAVVAPGPFPRTWRYPADEVSNNTNINQNAPTNKTFWDTNPDNFIH